MDPNGPSNQEMPIHAQVAPPAAVEPLPDHLAGPTRSGGTGRAVMIVVMLGLMIVLALSILLNMALLGTQSVSASSTELQEELFSPDKYTSGDDKIAIISVEGTILSTSGYVKNQIDQAARDGSVKAIVLRVDSPGGSVSASDYYYHHLSKLRTESKKPIVVSMGSMAASGGYYIAMAAGTTEDVLFAEPTCFTGSIGVMIPHYNAAGLFEKFGIEEDAVVSHRLKNMGSLGRRMTDEERAIFQELVDEGFGRFKEIIRDNRTEFQEDEAILDELATGQIFTAGQAEESGLIDKIGFIEDAIERAIQLAGTKADETMVVRYKRLPSLASLLMGAQAQPRGFDLQQLLDLSAPRAYYMTSTIPALVRNQP